MVKYIGIQINQIQIKQITFLKKCKKSKKKTTSDLTDPRGKDPLVELLN